MEKELLDKETVSLLGRDNCFNLLKLLFAFSIIAVHYHALSGKDMFRFLPGGMIVQLFFIISGFHVCYSYIKNPDLKLFIEKRLRRILPAYILVVLLGFFGGIFLTTMSVTDYLTSVDTYKYLLANLTFMNFIAPSLPGVFESDFMHNSAINGSLWYMKVEIMFYITVPIFYYLAKRFNKFWVTFFIILFSLLYDIAFMYLYERTGNNLFQILRRQIFSQLIYFYSGVFVLLYYKVFLKYMRIVFPLSVVVLAINDRFHLLEMFIPICLAVVLIGTAYLFRISGSIEKRYNFSYGIYLFHYPIIQCLVYYGCVDTYPVVMFFVVLLITLLLSVLSWKYIEIPIIRKRYF